MAHDCILTDRDTYFVIDHISREMTSSTRKKTLMQGDHNSERYTFEVPRYIEGHDMSQCTKIEVHYNNISKDKQSESRDCYQCGIVQVSNDILLFDWVISRNATKYVGSLNFLVKFTCVDEDGNQDYVWFTDIYSDVSISESIDNSAAVAEDVSDILESWKREILEGYATQKYVDEAVSNVQVDLTGYATETYVDEKVATIDLSGYATQEEVKEIAEGVHYTEDEALQLVVDLGLVEPLTDENGDIYTDESDNILTL